MDRRLFFVCMASACVSCSPASQEDSGDAESETELSHCRDDNNPCTSEARVARRCTHAPLPDGTPCPGGVCKAGTCRADPSPADAGATSDSSSDSSAGPDASTTPDAGSANGIAAKYPGDVGIETDPDVIFADGFESYSTPSDLWQRWDNVYQQSQTRITTTSANVWAGGKALEFNLPAQNTELSNAVDKALATEVDELYLRFHSKFDTSFDVVGSSHNGAFISAHYLGPGIPANGTNHFLASLECGREEVSTKTPGLFNLYLYHPEQRDIWGDHFFPTGVVIPYSNIPYDFGPEFVARPDFIPELGRWYAYEFMVRANTPGKRDGRITMWIDGRLVADFPNLRLRDVDTLKINKFSLAFHARNNPIATRKWFDNVVAAKHYIGPMVR